MWKTPQPILTPAAGCVGGNRNGSVNYLDCRGLHPDDLAHQFQIGDGGDMNRVGVGIFRGDHEAACRDLQIQHVLPRELFAIRLDMR